MKIRKIFLFLVVLAFMSLMLFASFTFAGSYTQLTTGAYSDYAGRISPDDSKVVFFSDRSGNWDIYIINIDGTNLTRLTTHDNRDYQPHWSPDGTKIVFKSNSSGYSNIWAMDSDGSNKTQLTSCTGGYDTWPPHRYTFGADFSYDGSQIVYDCYATGNYDIWVMDSDGSNATRLTSNSADDANPCFSPDGTKIVFWSNRSNNENKDIYIMNSDGSGQTQLTTDSEDDFHPHFNHDGTQIGFISRRDGTSKIYTMNVDGSSQTRKFSDSYFDAGLSWNSDGSKQVFSKDWDGSGDVNIWLYTESTPTRVPVFNGWWLLMGIFPGLFLILRRVRRS